MENKKNKITSVTVGLAIVVGVAINELLSSQTDLPNFVNWIITVVVSATVHELLFFIFLCIIKHSEFLLKLFWGPLYIKGFWTYTYVIGDTKKYGAWCIDQTLDSVKIKGFGLTKDGVRRSDVQSMTSLIRRGNDWEVINMRRDLSDTGEWSDVFFYSKTTLHMQQRTTFLNLCPYPLKMDGNTIIYGGELSGQIHNQLVFTKHKEAKNEQDIEKILLDKMRK